MGTLARGGLKEGKQIKIFFLNYLFFFILVYEKGPKNVNSISTKEEDMHVPQLLGVTSTNSLVAEMLDNDCCPKPRVIPMFPGPNFPGSPHLHGT